MSTLLEDRADLAGDHPEGGPDVPAWEPRRDRLTAVALFLVVWIVYLATANYTVSQVNDNRATTLMAWSLGTQGSIDLPAEWQGEIPWESEGTRGQLLTDRFPGAWLWATPFHAVAGAMSGREVPPHPALVDHGPSAVAAATATALGVLVSYLLFRRLADRRLALIAAGVLAFATGTWSVSANEMWTHGLTHLTLTLGVLAAARGRLAASGLAFACAVVTRPQTAVVPLVVGLWRGVTARSLRPVIVIGVTSGLGVVAMVTYSRLTFGTWLPIAGYGEGKVASVATVPWTSFLLRLGGGLFHPVRGILVFAPFVVVLLPWVRRGWRASPWWARSAAVGGLLYFAVQLRANGFEGGHNFFGSRLGLEPLVLSAPLLVRTWQAGPAKVFIARGLVICLVIVSLVLHGVAAIYRSATPTHVEWWHRYLEVVCDDLEEERWCDPVRRRLDAGLRALPGA